MFMNSWILKINEDSIPNVDVNEPVLVRGAYLELCDRNGYIYSSSSHLYCIPKVTYEISVSSRY